MRARWFYVWLVEKVTPALFNQSESVKKQKQSEPNITFDTQLKTALHRRPENFEYTRETEFEITNSK